MITFEESIAKFNEVLIQKEKEKFQPGFEPFDIYAERIKVKTRDAFINFQQKFKRGYEILIDALQSAGLQRPQLSVTVAGGIYQVHGLSPEQLLNFYKIARQFTSAKEFERGRDLFFCLATLAPQVADFWLGLAISSTYLEEYGPAIEALLCAIGCDPTKVRYYQQGVHLYLKTKQNDKAKALCQQGMDYAASHPQEPWSQELKTALHTAQIALKWRGG